MHGFGANLAYQSLLITIEDPTTRQTRQVWFHLTSFLHHAAMISKLLAPVRKAGEMASVRGKALKEALGVRGDSEVLPREARNNVEHFDERMDRWIADANSTILEMVLDDRDGYDYLHVAEKRVKRVLIANELVFVSEREDSTKFELRLQPVYKEVERIKHAADRWLERSSPYHYLFPPHERQL